MTERAIANLVVKENPMLFRNDCGCGFVGGRKIYVPRTGRYFAERGDLVIINPKRISYGLTPGSGDYVGWEQIEITPDMVGKKIAVFKSVEIKTINDELSDSQKNWYSVVIADGGLAEVWQETDDGIEILSGGDIDESETAKIKQKSVQKNNKKIL